VVLALVLLLQAPSATCADVPDCRAQAQAAAARGDYEIFHDLAWRAVQRGKPNDPDLMALLARAQALSGRPGDALVMLGRLADLPVATELSRAQSRDALTSDDFRVVRLLPGWSTLEARLTGSPAPPAPPAPVAPSAPVALSVPLAPSAPESLAFDAAGLDPHGLAHDAVSRRFVVGDRQTPRLLVIDEVSHHVVSYVSAASAGFFEDLTAFTIDARRGDLWVVSVNGEADASSSVLHKLQLVSGRALLEARTTQPARLVGVTVTPDGTVYALDWIDSRIFRLRAGARALETVMRLDARRPTALAAADDRLLYVAADQGRVRVDVAARSAAPVKSVEALTDFESLSWRAGALIGVERVAGSSLIVRIALDAAGLRAQPRHVLAASPGATVGALGGDTYYYVAAPGIIRRLALR
jgi:hypothetical protein